MKRVYWLLPCLALTAFAGYYHHWDAANEKSVVCKVPRDPFVEYARRNGSRDAETDLARGTPKILTCGLPVHWIREYAEIMQRDYGIQQHAVAGCMVSDSLIKYVDDYNRVIDRHLGEKYGQTIFADAQRKAEELYAERNQE